MWSATGKHQFCADIRSSRRAILSAAARARITEV
jgi:hypothetical protein